MRGEPKMVKPAEDKYGDLPIYELMQKAQQLIAEGCLVFFKFTCEKCGTRQGFETPNTLFKSGRCEECGHITKIKKAGFMVMMAL